MNPRPTNILTEMFSMLTLFASKCTDKTTLRKLIELANDPARLSEGHVLFEEIRGKTLAAEKRKDESAVVQYAFEEMCAKTLFNLTHPAAPFDADCAFWVLPWAVHLGARLGISKPGQISPLLEPSQGRPATGNNSAP